MPRFKDGDWNLPKSDKGNPETWDAVKIAVLMDIRDELKRLNSLLHCSNFMAIPWKLDRIAKNTTKPRKRKPRTLKP